MVWNDADDEERKKLGPKEDCVEECEYSNKHPNVFLVRRCIEC